MCLSPFTGATCTFSHLQIDLWGTANAGFVRTPNASAPTRTSTTCVLRTAASSYVGIPSLRQRCGEGRKYHVVRKWLQYAYLTAARQCVRSKIELNICSK